MHDSEDGGPESSSTDSSRSAVRSDPALRVTLALLALPFALIALRGFVLGEHLTGDRALIALRTWDVGTHTPFVGTYSRMGWNHPGPLMFWLLAIPCRVFGATAAGLSVGAAGINFTAAALSVVLLRRRGGVRAALLAAGAILAFIAARPHLVTSVWNPWLVLLPFLLVIVAAWAVACGDTAGLPVLVATASFVVQTHLGSALPVAAASLWAVGCLAWRGRGESPPPALGRPLLLSAVLVSAAWYPVVWDQVFGSGNLGKLWVYAQSPGRELLGVSRALSLTASVLTPWGLWTTLQRVGGGIPPVIVAQPAVLLTLPFAGLVAGTYLAWRRGASAHAMFLALEMLLAATSVCAVASIDGHPWTYMFAWLWVLGIAIWCSLLALVGGWSARADRRRWGGEDPPVSRAAVAAIGVLSLVAAQRIGGLELDVPMASRAVAVLAPLARSALPAGSSVTLQEFGAFPARVQGLALELARSGVRLVFPKDQVRHWGEHRSVGVTPADVQLVVAIGPEVIGRLTTQPAFRQVGLFDPADEPRRGGPTLFGGWTRPVTSFRGPDESAPIALFMRK